MNDRNRNCRKGWNYFQAFMISMEGEICNYLIKAKFPHHPGDMTVLLLDLITNNIYTFNYQYFDPKITQKNFNWLG